MSEPNLRMLHQDILHAGEPIRLPWDKHNAPPLLFTWKMFISTDFNNIHVLESICSRI